MDLFDLFAESTSPDGNSLNEFATEAPYKDGDYMGGDDTGDDDEDGFLAPFVKEGTEVILKMMTEEVNKWNRNLLLGLIVVIIVGFGLTLCFEIRQRKAKLRRLKEFDEKI